MITILILAMLAATAITIARVRGVFVAVMLTGIYTLLSAIWMLVLDAPDVAFTEAAVGAGVATVLMLSALALTTNQERIPDRPAILPLVVVILTGSVLVYGTLDLPNIGDPMAPAQRHVAPRYLHESPHEIHVPNVVTAVLASYRGYDTLGETAVIFTAGLGVIMILGGGHQVLSWQTNRRREDEEGAVEVDDYTAAPLPEPRDPMPPEHGWDERGESMEPEGDA
jgi:multicomponent Na+:H+ antiporter subunit B